MAATVSRISVLDPAYHNGTAWDGDLTLHEAELVEGDERDSVLFVVQRGNAFIPTDVVARRIDGLGLSLHELRSRAKRPAPDRRPHIDLSIEPGDE